MELTYKKQLFDKKHRLHFIIIKIDNCGTVCSLSFISTVQRIPEPIGSSPIDSSCPYTGQLIGDKAAASPTTGYS